ncbi:MAG: PilZ domain-containing protein [Nitrospira sp.]|nr:PilZ domain-containing protein [Nitrospira sp.]
MSILELLGILGVATIAAYALARVADLDWHRALMWTGGSRSRRASTKRWKTDYVSETTPAYFHYVRRRYRYEIRCPVRYCINGQIREGVVVDMTREGWRLKGQEALVPGTMLSLDITLPGAASSLPIARAVVRWVEGGECGVKLERMEPEPAAQLSQFFSTLSQGVNVRSQAA